MKNDQALPTEEEIKQLAEELDQKFRKMHDCAVDLDLTNIEFLEVCCLLLSSLIMEAPKAQRPSIINDVTRKFGIMIDMAKATS